MADLDPRWEWIDVTPAEQPPGTEFIRAYCRHLNVVPFGTGSMCLTCEAPIAAGA